MTKEILFLLIKQFDYQSYMQMNDKSDLVDALIDRFTVQELKELLKELRIEYNNNKEEEEEVS